MFSRSRDMKNDNETKKSVLNLLFSAKDMIYPSKIPHSQAGIKLMACFSIFSWKYLIKFNESINLDN